MRAAPSSGRRSGQEATDTLRPASPREGGGSRARLAAPSPALTARNRLADPQITHTSDVSKGRTPGDAPGAGLSLTGLSCLGSGAWGAGAVLTVPKDPPPSLCTLGRGATAAQGDGRVPAGCSGVLWNGRPWPGEPQAHGSRWTPALATVGPRGSPSPSSRPPYNGGRLQAIQHVVKVEITCLHRVGAQ